MQLTWYNNSNIRILSFSLCNFLSSFPLHLSLVLVHFFSNLLSHAFNTRSLIYRIIFNTVQCDSICRYLLPLHDSVSWSSAEGIRSLCSRTTITKFVIHTVVYLLHVIIVEPQKKPLPRNASTQKYNNWVMKSVSRQWLDKHISAYRTVLCNAVTSSTIRTVHSIESVFP
jgi:hypothetical protein